jgi:phage tail sheath protein FI
MPTYDAPGVYVEEHSGGAKPIRAVSTSTACFVGFTEKAARVRRIDGVDRVENLALKPIMVTNWNEYQEAFGGYVAGIYTPLSVNGFFENGGTKCYIVSIGQIAEKINQILIPLAITEEASEEPTADDRPILTIETFEATRDQAIERRNEAATANSEAIASAAQVGLQRTRSEKRASDLERAQAAAEKLVKTAASLSAEAAAQARAELDRIETELAEAKTQLAEHINFHQSALQASEDQEKALRKAEKDLLAAEEALTMANSAVQNSGRTINKYLTVKAKQASSDPLLRIRIEPTPAANGQQNGNGNGQTDINEGDQEVSRFELIVERRLQTVSDDPERQWKELERKGVTVALDNKEQLKLKYRGGSTPKHVDVTIDSALRPNVNGARNLESFFGRDAQEIQSRDSQNLSIDVDHRELISVGAGTVADGEDGRDPVLGILSDYEDISIICMPDLMLAHRPASHFFDADDRERFVQNIQQKMIAHCENMGERVVILDSPPNKNFQEVKAWIRGETAGYDTSYAALYYPWIKVMDPATNEMIEMPPSGHVAGVWARNDDQRGVHKAPANEIIRGVLDLSEKVSHRHQETLNPIGVNCIRFFPGRGYRIWGARTLSSDPEWKYLNVRRLFNMIKQSIQESTQWAVFEPNDQRLWSKLRRDVGNFLMSLYSQGALFGATAAQAYFVKCDESNNPKITRDLGQLFVDIGIAPVLPAEFIIFRIRQWSDEEPEE